MGWSARVCLIMLKLGVVELSSGSSERRRYEPKCWLKFEDVVHCRDVASFNAFVEQFVSERRLVGEDRRHTYWALRALAISLADIRVSLGLPCFSAWHLIVLFSSSRSVHLHFHSSPILKPVSLSACRAVESFLAVPFMSASISFSVGTKGIVSFRLYCGGVHWMPFIFAYSLYVYTAIIRWPSLHVFFLAM